MRRVDFLGPISVHKGLNCETRNVCFFGSLHTCSARLRVAFKLDTDSFFMARMRLVGRLSALRTVYSGNRTRFVGRLRTGRQYSLLGSKEYCKSPASKRNPLAFQPFFAPVTEVASGNGWVQRLLSLLTTDQVATDEALETRLVDSRCTSNKTLLVVISLRPNTICN